jgi:molecular chaperone GrpE
MTDKLNDTHEEDFLTSQTRGSAEELVNEEGKLFDEAAADSDTGSFEHVDSQLVQLEAELAAANDRAIRAHAELENFRKRVYREMEEERKYACLPLFRGLLPVMDNLQRAIESAQQNHDAQGLLEGVQLVTQQLEAVLQQHHCTRIDAKGKLFDPHLHEAIAQLPSQDFSAGIVIDVTLPGYVLHDRVVRASQVLVSAGAPPNTDQTG